MIPVGQRLRDARESAGFLISDVEFETKIPGSALQKLEEERFGDFPNEVYARAFLASYGDFLGVDTSEVQKQFSKPSIGKVEQFAYLKRSETGLVAAPLPVGMQRGETSRKLGLVQAHVGEYRKKVRQKYELVRKRRKQEEDASKQAGGRAHPLSMAGLMLLCCLGTAWVFQQGERVEGAPEAVNEEAAITPVAPGVEADGDSDMSPNIEMNPGKDGPVPVSVDAIDPTGMPEFAQARD